jgi:hypothetical protein
MNSVKTKKGISTWVNCNIIDCINYLVYIWVLFINFFSIDFFDTNSILIELSKLFFVFLHILQSVVLKNFANIKMKMKKNV